MVEQTGNRSADDFDYGDEPRLKAALADVRLPTGLELRIKSALRARYPVSAGAGNVDTLRVDSVDAQHIDVASVDVDPNVAHDRDVLEANVVAASVRSADVGENGWLRRSLIVLALAAGICGFAFLASRWTRPAEPSWLAGQCDLILEKLENDNPATWQPIDQGTPAIPSAVKSQLARLAFVSQRPLAAVSPKISANICDEIRVCPASASWVSVRR